MEAVVDVGVIDQPFPPDRCSGLLKVGTHDDEEVVGVALFEFQETIGVVKGSGWVVDGARADDNEEASFGVCAVNDRDDIVAGREDGGFAVGALGWCEPVQ